MVTCGQPCSLKSVLFEEIRVFQACAVVNGKTREWYVFENHAEWSMCLFLVPRRAPVERSSSLLRSVLFRACAQLRGLCAGSALSFFQL